MTDQEMASAATAAALAGWAQNPGAPVLERLVAAKQSLNYYVNQTDQLHALLEDLEKSYPEPAPMSTQAVVIERLRAILGVED